MSDLVAQPQRLRKMGDGMNGLAACSS